MLDVFKEGAEAWLQRIKSPLIGSILLSFVAINWKAIFFVLFSDSPILLRFWYFDNETSLTSLLCYPIGAGLIVGLATPFLNFFGGWIANWPTYQARELQAVTASRLVTRKDELAAQRELDSAKFKEALLRDAEATQALIDADLNDDLRAEVESKVSAWETEKLSGLGLSLRNQKITQVDRLFIDILGRNQNSLGWRIPKNLEGFSKAFVSNYSELVAEVTNHRIISDAKSSLARLEALGLVQSFEGGYYSLTQQGYAIFDENNVPRR